MTDPALPGEAGATLPRRIWFLWYQGLDVAPEVVKACHRSWVDHNPTWEVVALDRSNLADYVEDSMAGVDREQLTLTRRSNLTRLQLLGRYGGVWVDATCLCIRPLDSWIWDQARSGFFAFAQPARDRLIATWFLAAVPDCAIVTGLERRLRSYWTENTFPGHGRWRRRLTHVMNRTVSRHHRTTRVWFTWPVRRVLGLLPYFHTHYLFERLVATDAECRAIWARTPRLSARGPHRAQREGLLGPLTPALRSEIEARIEPLYKLSWKYPTAAPTEGTVIGFLLSASANRPPLGPASPS